MRRIDLNSPVRNFVKIFSHQDQQPANNTILLIFLVVWSVIDYCGTYPVLNKSFYFSQFAKISVQLDAAHDYRNDKLTFNSSFEPPQ